MRKAQAQIAKEQGIEVFRLERVKDVQEPRDHSRYEGEYFTANPEYAGKEFNGKIINADIISDFHIGSTPPYGCGHIYIPVESIVKDDENNQENAKNNENELNINEKGSINNNSFIVEKSLGAMAKRFYVKDKKGLYNDTDLYIKEGSEVTGVLPIAVGEEIREVNRLIKEYRLPNGQLTKAKDWHKVRGTAIVTNGDKELKQEVHWYQCKNVGKVEFKLKIWGTENEK